MEGEPRSPPQSVASGSIVESARAHMLGEAVGLTVDQVCGPLKDPAFAKRLIGSIISNDMDCTIMLKNMAEDCRSSFQVRAFIVIGGRNEPFLQFLAAQANLPLLHANIPYLGQLNRLN